MWLNRFSISFPFPSFSQSVCMLWNSNRTNPIETWMQWNATIAIYCRTSVTFDASTKLKCNDDVDDDNMVMMCVRNLYLAKQHSMPCHSVVTFACDFSHSHFFLLSIGQFSWWESEHMDFFSTWTSVYELVFMSFFAFLLLLLFVMNEFHMFGIIKLYFRKEIYLRRECIESVYRLRLVLYI